MELKNWTRGESVGRHINRYSNESGGHILWDGVSLWYGAPYQDVSDKSHDPDNPQNYTVYARKKGQEPSLDADLDECNQYSVRMVYFPKDAVPHMLLFGRVCFEQGFEAAILEASKNIGQIKPQTQL